jgi:hypothetical protein
MPFLISLVHTETCPWCAGAVVAVCEAGDEAGKSSTNPPFPPFLRALLSELCFVGVLTLKGEPSGRLLSSSLDPLPSRPVLAAALRCPPPPRASAFVRAHTVYIGAHFISSVCLLCAADN